MFCSIFKLMISHAADGDNRLSETTEKHITHCASCREFYETCLSLGEGLTREAAISNEEVSERLSARVPKVMSRRRIDTYTVRLRLWPIMAAACVALIALIGILFLALRRDGQDAGPTAQVEPIAELRAMVGEDFAAGWPGLIEEPLANELNNLANDTESALRFLVACVAVDITDIDNKSMN
ncbi:MAG: hypothetical protein ACYS6W_12165 [Planctomycetota bacterium]|jgi:predicted anti-sigma-YlaC factor YlaD